MENVKNDNKILYIGMGLMAIGLVTTFVGLGDKGFRTVGPSIVILGALLAVFRLSLCCAVPPQSNTNTQDEPQNSP